MALPDRKKFALELVLEPMLRLELKKFPETSRLVLAVPSPILTPLVLKLMSAVEFSPTL
jgi:hypothetical protein